MFDGVEDEEKGAKEHQGMLCVQWIERLGARGAWHRSSVSDGGSSGLRHGLPFHSSDMKMKDNAEIRVAEGTRAGIPRAV